MYIFKVSIRELQSKADEFRDICAEFAEIKSVSVNPQKCLARIVTVIPLEKLREILSQRNFHLTLINEQIVNQTDNASHESSHDETFTVHGISCASCEVKIERTLGKLPRVQFVDVDAKKKTVRIKFFGKGAERLHEFNKHLDDLGYTLVRGGHKEISEVKKRPSVWEVLALLVLAWTIGSLLGKLGVFKANIAAGENISFIAAFILGLVAASSQCIAVVGGLVLSLVAKFRETNNDASGMKLAQPIILFGLGRVASYGIFGGLIGYIGNVFSPSPFVTGMITVAAAVLMVAIGLNILGITPRLLIHLQVRAPRGFMRKIHDLSENSTHSLAPLIIGALTFFIPCGFTQSLQIYALGSGSPQVGAVTLFAFALGTLPAIIALWYASNAFRGKMGQFFFRLAGAAVLLLGLINIQNGLVSAGYNVKFPSIFSESSNVVRAAGVEFNGREQIMKMNVAYNGYNPNEFTVRAGIPVRWEVSGDIVGCTSVLQAPKLGIVERLQRDKTTVINFTPNEIGDVLFSCSMGMFRGVIHVVSST